MLKPTQIRGMLMTKGYSYADIARELGVSRQSVRSVATGLIRSARIERRISQILEMDTSDIWPPVVDQSSPKKRPGSMSDSPEVPPSIPGKEAA